MTKLYVYGASGHGLVVADIAKACGYEDIVFIDDGENEHLTFEEIKEDRKTPIVLGIGVNEIREKLFEKVKSFGFTIATLIHPSTMISPSVMIGEGTVIMPHVVINAKSRIGVGVILNTSCVIEHESSIEDFVHISPSVAVAGNVKIGESTHVGIGSSIIQGITIGKKCIIGAGSVVVEDIKNDFLCYGNPCKPIKENK